MLTLHHTGGGGVRGEARGGGPRLLNTNTKAMTAVAAMTISGKGVNAADAHIGRDIWGNGEARKLAPLASLFPFFDVV